MSFEVNQEKSFNKPANEVFAAALKAVEGLGGKVSKQDPESGELEVQYDKKILGKTLGDRTHMTFKVCASDSGAKAVVEAYPLDAIGRKLMFGARKGVTQTVVTWFWAHLEHHLG